MHVTTKEVDNDGVHILTSILEGDGATALASENAKLHADVISVQRTASGGIQVQTAVQVEEPQAAKAEAPAPEPTQEEQAAAYLISKGLSIDEAKEAVAKFGAAKVLAKRQQELTDELDALVR
jgi:hypothetical protein